MFSHKNTRTGGLCVWFLKCCPGPDSTFRVPTCAQGLSSTFPDTQGDTCMVISSRWPFLLSLWTSGEVEFLAWAPSLMASHKLRSRTSTVSYPYEFHISSLPDQLFYYRQVNFSIPLTQGSTLDDSLQSWNGILLFLCYLWPSLSPVLNLFLLRRVHN